MSCTGCSRSIIRMHLVVASAVSLSGMYVMCECDSHKWGRDLSARLM